MLGSLETQKDVLAALEELSEVQNSLVIDRDGERLITNIFGEELVEEVLWAILDFRLTLDASGMPNAIFRENLITVLNKVYAVLAVRKIIKEDIKLIQMRNRRV